MIESDIELMAIKQLEALGYSYLYGPDIESKGKNPLRSYKQVILEWLCCTNLSVKAFSAI